MKKKAFLLFFATVSLMIVGALFFIQSPTFANLIKDVLARRLPGDLGIEGDFSEFRVTLLPPGVSIRNPQLRLGKHNVLDLPQGSTVHADRLDLRFRLFQMLSGSIRVNEVAIVNGDVKLVLSTTSVGPAKKKEKKSLLQVTKPEFHWDELLQVRVEALSIENTKLHLEFTDAPFTADLVAKSLRVGQWQGIGGLGYQLAADVSGLHATGLENWVAPDAIENIVTNVHLNALGVEMDELSVAANGVSIEAKGSVKGNVLQPKNLLLDANVKVDGSIASALKLGGKPTQAIDADGTLAFVGKVKGNLDKLAETLKVEGQAEIDGARYGASHADHVSLDAGYALAGPKGGEISLSKLIVTEKESARSGGNHPGDGGKVEVGAFHTALPIREPVTVPIKIERAHIHWLGAPVLKAVYPLDLRATGTLAATYLPETRPGNWAVQTKVALTITDFQLDNQRLGKEKPMQKVFHVPQVQLNGAVNLDRSGVAFNGITLELPHTKLSVGGKVDSKTGFDLNASGPVDFADFEQIAGNDIRGAGTVQAHVHGPSARVFLDFDVDLKEAQYLHLNLGDLKGRITWDDDPQFLIFTKMAAQRGRTAYGVDGKLDLGPGKDTIALDVRVPQGDIQDFIQIFDNLTKPLWWFPHELNGDMKGTLKVSGGVALNELVVDADIAGTNWEFQGERFRVLNLRGGYDKGGYVVRDLTSFKQNGKIAGHLTFDADNKFDWAFHTQDFTLSDFDHLARLDVPFRGKVQIDSVGNGRQGAVQSKTQATLTDAAVRGTPLPPSEGSIRTENGVAVVKANVGEGQAMLDVNYDFRDGAESTFRSDLKKFDFSPILLLLNSKSMQDPSLAGHASGSVQLKFRTGAAERATGKVDISDYLLAKTGSQFVLDHPVSFRVNEGSFQIPDLAVRFAGGGSQANVQLESNRGALNGKVSGDVDLSIVQFLTSAISSTTGTMGLDYRIGGTLKDPQITGKSVIDGGTLRVAALDSPFENVDGTFLLKQNQISIQSFQADLSGGRVTADGDIEIHADHYPTIKLKGVLGGSKIKVYPFQYAKVRGQISVEGDERPYLVSGAVTIDQAVSHEKVFNRQSGEGLKAIQYTPPPTAQREGSIPLFKLKIDAVADRGIVIQNDLFDAEAGGRMTVIGTLETPRILGSAEISQGKIQFKDRTFQIQSATATFDNPTVIDPIVNLTASTDIGSTKVQLVVSGHLSTMKIDLSSNPAMGESDILSLLAVGAGSTGVANSRFFSTDHSGMDVGEAGSLLLHSLDFNREVQNKTGLQIQLDESVNPLQAQSMFRPGAVVDTSAPKIVIKRQLTPKLGVSYGSTVGVGTSKQNEVNAELQVSPAFSVIGVWDYYETTDTKTTETSYGADLKLQKRFK